MDLDLREAERRAAGAGPQEQAAVLRRQVRAGELELGQLKIAALLGHRPAALAADVRCANADDSDFVVGKWALEVHNQARTGGLGWEWRHELYRRVASALNDTLVTRICRCSRSTRAEVLNAQILAAKLDEPGHYGARSTTPFTTTSRTPVPIPGLSMTLPPGLFRIMFQAEVTGEAVVQIEEETKEGAVRLASQAFAFYSVNDPQRQTASIDHMGEFGAETVVRASIRATQPACESWRIMYEILDGVSPDWASLEDVAAWVLQ